MFRTVRRLKSPRVTHMAHIVKECLTTFDRPFSALFLRPSSDFPWDDEWSARMFAAI